MDEGEDQHADRACTHCGEPVPKGRSVCPSCGSLQRAQAGPGGETYQPAPRPVGPSGQGPISGAVPSIPAPPVAYPMSTAPAAPTAHRPRRSRAGAIVAVIVVLAVIAGVAAGAVYLDHRNNDDTSASPSTSSKGTTKGSSSDPRPGLVRGYCANPRPLTGPGKIATFTPGAGTVAYVEFPQPASTTEEAGERVVQVSPKIGRPNLDLDASINLVSLAVCVDQTGSREVPGSCDYDLTNPSSVGQSASAKLLETTYRVRMIELRTGKTLARGTVKTPTDTCPEYAYIGGKGVSNPVTEDLLLGWIGQHLVAGKPS